MRGCERSFGARLLRNVIESSAGFYQSLPSSKEKRAFTRVLGGLKHSKVEIRRREEKGKKQNVYKRNGSKYNKYEAAHY